MTALPWRTFQIRADASSDVFRVRDSLGSGQGGKFDMPPLWYAPSSYILNIILHHPIKSYPHHSSLFQSPHHLHWHHPHFTFVVLHMFFIVPSTVCSEKYIFYQISICGVIVLDQLFHDSILIFEGIQPVWELLKSVRWSARTLYIGEGSTRK